MPPEVRSCVNPPPHSPWREDRVARSLGESARRLRAGGTPRTGSVLVIVLVALVFAAVALTAFMEKAGNDLLMETREADMLRLRMEAQSALETTLAVLEDFRAVNGGLRSPAEGWDDPLGFIGYEPGEGTKIDVSFEDESGKLSLPTIEGPTLVALFKGWGLHQSDAERMSDALLGWMRPDYVAASAGAPGVEDYDRGELPYKPPTRSLRSFSELAAIKVVNEFFYDEKGRPNELWRRFRDTVSLYNYKAPNLNAAPGDALAALSNFDPLQQKRFEEYRRGEGAFARQGPGYFKSTGDAAAIAGGQNSITGFGVDIRALRIRLLVHKGAAHYELTVVVAPPGGAQLVRSGSAAPSRTEGQPKAQDNAGKPTPAMSGAGGAKGGDGAAKKLNYPFTLLEITENVVMSSQYSPEPAL